MSDSLQDRKLHHLNLTWDAQMSPDLLDDRFYYEPFKEHISPKAIEGFTGMRFPLWISSMTGGTQIASQINQNLAKAANEFGLAMGLGSCRILIENNYQDLADFDVRNTIGSQPLYANLGIAQLHQYVNASQLSKVDELINRLQADGLIIHINPLQEFFQQKGDDINFKMIDTINKVVDHATYPIIVKEVGQGMGPMSLRMLMELPLHAIDTASAGGTNFALLELLRSGNLQDSDLADFTKVGQSVTEMSDLINMLLKEMNAPLCKNFILSGGIRNFLDGFYLLERTATSCIYGQASALLKPAMSSYEELSTYIQTQIRGYRLAEKYLVVKETNG